MEFINGLDIGIKYFTFLNFELLHMSFQSQTGSKLASNQDRQHQVPCGGAAPVPWKTNRLDRALLEDPQILSPGYAPVSSRALLELLERTKANMLFLLIFFSFSLVFTICFMQCTNHTMMSNLSKK